MIFLTLYTFILGRKPGEGTILDKRNVGITNYHHLTGLLLEDGIPFYATVTGTISLVIIMLFCNNSPFDVLVL